MASTSLILLGLISVVFACDPEFSEPSSGRLDCTCSISPSGEIMTYDGTHLLIWPDTYMKSLVSKWEENQQDECKFRLRVVPDDGLVSWIGFSVGVHKNAKKFWRNFAFDRRSMGQVEARGWKMKVVKPISSELPYTWTSDGGADATVYGDETDGYVINSTVCKYSLTYRPHALPNESILKLQINQEYYQTPGDKLRGWCQNCNGDPEDDYRMCKTLQSVKSTPNALESLSSDCDETDKTVINV